jgi:hypothetical protein
MATDMKRFTITVTSDIEQCVEELKRGEFYNKPYSELYRYIISAGVLAIRSGAYQQDGEQNTTI